MQTMQRKPLRTLAALAAGTVLAIGFHMTASAATPENATPEQHDHQNMQHDWAHHRQEQMKAHLAKAAEHLNIQPAQQAAWQAYVNAIESPVGDARKPHEMATDAAGIARHRADIAAGFAAKMMNIAEATASLQAVLTPEQQQKFNKMVKHAWHHDHRGWHRHDHSLQHDDAQQSGSKSGANQPATYQ